MRALNRKWGFHTQRLLSVERIGKDDYRGVPGKMVHGDGDGILLLIPPGWNRPDVIDGRTGAERLGASLLLMRLPKHVDQLLRRWMLCPVVGTLLPDRTVRSHTPAKREK